MRLHTSLTPAEVQECLALPKTEGKIAGDVEFAAFYSGRKSLTHPFGYEIQLGAYDRNSLLPNYRDRWGNRMRTRRYKNSGTGGAGRNYAATWHEWGWFIAEIFFADPQARWGSNPARCARPQYAQGYFSPQDFHDKTGGVFRLDIPALRMPSLRSHRGTLFSGSRRPGNDRHLPGMPVRHHEIHGKRGQRGRCRPYGGMRIGQKSENLS